jgi:hypothetical protein
MSDFLNNVTARALGVADAVQPRIPSLFEPYRADEGPFVTRTAWSSADAELEAEQPRGETSDLARRSAPIVTPESPDAEPLHADAPATSHPQWRTRDAPSDTREAEKPGQSATHPRSLQEKASGGPGSEVSPLQPAQTGANRREAPLLEGPRPPVAAPPAGLPGAQPGKFSLSEPAAPLAQSGLEEASQPLAKPAVRPPVAHAMETSALTAGPWLRRAVDAGNAMAAPQAFLPKVQPKDSPPPHAPAAESDSAATTDVPDRRFVPALTWISSQELPPRASAPAQAEPRGAEVHPRAAEGSRIAAPAARRNEAAGSRVALPAESPAEPPVEITIGTVEVRAIFPEKAASRAPSRRPKPGLSLSEYLKRPSRGSR